ncbi:MAG: alkaline phosphatase [Candidatus Aminicenantes bacterium]|nr:alkaline phosphatase [Candidatus Aminicenantes bacterium]
MAIIIFLTAGITLATFFSCRRALRPLNIILMISDGCGYNCFNAASLYQYGRTGMQVYDSFPVQCAVCTHSASSTPYDPKKAWTSFEFILSDPTDSAAAATAMATGIKTNDGTVGLDPGGAKLINVVDLAEVMGKKTGTVTSVQFCHATPAAFIAKAENRYQYEKIAYQIIKESPVDVVMGCGHPYYDGSGRPVEEPNFRYVGNRGLWEGLVNGEPGADADGDGKPDPWTVIQTAEKFRGLIEGKTPERVFGIAPILKTLQQGREGDVLSDPFDVPLVTSVPTLAEMSLAAINVLDDDPDGFFLMVEGGAVDWAGEENQKGRLIEEQIFFNQAVQAVVEWIETHSSWQDTLLIVTTDHDTGYITGPGSGKEPPDGDLSKTWKDLVNKGKGKVPDMEWHSEYHTNALVPLFANGFGSERMAALADKKDRVRGNYLDNTDIGRVIIELLIERSAVNH